MRPRRTVFSDVAIELHRVEAKREDHPSAGIFFRRNASVMRPHDLGHNRKT
jgi:hypothetical protein